MTDTEILDYLQESVTLRPGDLRDVQIGSVVMTLGRGTRFGTLREKLEQAINEDKGRLVRQVTRTLTGEAEQVIVICNECDHRMEGYRWRCVRCNSHSLHRA